MQLKVLGRSATKLAQEMGPLRGTTFKRIGITYAEEKRLKANMTEVHKVTNFF